MDQAPSPRLALAGEPLPGAVPAQGPSALVPICAFEELTDRAIQLLGDWTVLICTAYRPHALLLKLLLHRYRVQGAQLQVLGICTRSDQVDQLLPSSGERVLVITCDQLADGSCLPLVRRLRTRPRPPTLLVTLITPHRAILETLVQTGVEALVAQDSYGHGGLVDALESLQRGERHLDPRCRALLSDPQRWRDELTMRELEVLQLVAQGLTNRAIAQRLGISPITARDHVQHILLKLGVRDRTAAAVEGIHRGYLI